MSSFRLQKMDVLHFATHNICRGNHSNPQRAHSAVLKLSIVVSPAISARAPRAEGFEGSCCGALIHPDYCSSARKRWQFDSDGQQIQSQEAVKQWWWRRRLRENDDRRRGRNLNWPFSLIEKWCCFSVPQDFESSPLLKFVFEPEYYTHTAAMPLPGVDRVPGARVKTWLFEQQESEGYQIFISGTSSHATFLQGNVFLAMYPISVMARSRSPLGTNARSNVDVGLRSWHEKIVARLKAH